MSSNENRIQLFENILDNIELPKNAYERAGTRFEDLGEFLGRDQSSCNGNDPHVYPQGSFRLGTAIKPISGDEEYDLDLACTLRRGISSGTHSQEQLKTLVGNEVQAYRQSRGIQSPLREKHRCWRLNYKDELSFHMDIVPCIPTHGAQQAGLTESMIRVGGDPSVSASAADRAVLITDDRLQNYRTIHHNWNVSNPEGYALWFESRMRQASDVLLEKRAQVDHLPVFQRKTPLQRVVQLLKRHRDQMFAADQDRKPISIIITTLAAQIYAGENTIDEALRNAVDGLCRFADSGGDSVPNPVNPIENFADRWGTPEGRDLALQENFRNWAYMARSNVNAISTGQDTGLLAEVINQRFCVATTPSSIGGILGLATGPAIHTGPSQEIAHDSAMPWDDRGQPD